ncbi:YlxR family protein [Brevibacterium otitidis]|uniref:YlxR family protein n=1 Tax=Brevibacterium otitidis TaxID=53364 RepID=A0ABV5X5B8_9MICO
MCLACRKREPKSRLVRLAVVDDSTPHIAVDARRRLPGRGAWIHPDQRCLDTAVKRNAFRRALRTQAPADAQLLDDIRQITESS